MTSDLWAKYSYERRAWSLNAERSGSGHGHWSTTRKLTDEWRTAFYALGIQNRVKFHSAHIVASFVQRKPLQDTGNAYGSVKAAIDGLVDAGILPGDTPEFVLSLTMMAPQIANRGEVERTTLVLVAERREHEYCWLCEADRTLSHTAEPDALA